MGNEALEVVKVIMEGFFFPLEGYGKVLNGGVGGRIKVERF